ncbi:MAG TPA: ATP-binding protein [Methylomirabilota bacterium]|nr:ATP-binding protein [Methylomirabilota bacterium]
MLGLYAGGVFVFLRHNLLSALDRQLHDDFEVAEQMLARDGPDGVRWRLDSGHEEGETADSGRWVDVWSTTGRLLYKSPGRDIDVPAPRVAGSSVRDARPLSARLPGLGRVRVLAAPYAIGDLPVVLRVARSEDPLRHDLRELLLVLGLGLPLALGLAALGGFALARRALRPVRDMAERARTITADDLARRLPVDDPEGELGQLAIVFNDTFARLERSFAGLRRFTADASHELRTPLTAIKSVGEVGLRGRRDDHAYREIIGSMLEEADRLARLVDTLLVLSRADAGAVKLSVERIDLRALADEVTAQVEVLAEEKRQVLSIEAPARVEVIADRIILRQALLNLLDNAIKHSPEGGHVRVLVGERAGVPVIEVVDNGPGIPLEHQEAIFQRFYRVDPARTRGAGGVGLGLCIARWAVELHGGHIELESEEGKGSTFRIVCAAPALEDGVGPRSGSAGNPNR